jgi:putative flippase GtrA
VKLGRLLRFAAVGVANTGVYYLGYLLLHLVMPYLVAHVVATAVAMVFSYFVNCRFTFRVRPSWRTFALFPLSNAANVGMTTALLPVAVEWVGLDERIAPLVVGVLAIPVTYLVAHFVMMSPERAFRAADDGGPDEHRADLPPGLARAATR